MGWPGNRGPVSVRVKTNLEVEVRVAVCCARLEAPARFVDEVPADPGVSNARLKAVTSKSAQVTQTSRTVPPSHKTNSIRPGCNSHQRTRSRRLNEIVECCFLRLVGVAISCA